jgi:hypothetical protein
MNTEHGSKTWFFPDGDLPPAGNAEPKGHESLIILNPNSQDAKITLMVYFADKAAVVLNPDGVASERVLCIRTNEPIDGFQIPFGQYSLKVESTVPVICQIGRMDVRQDNLAYYTVMGYSQ